MKIEFFGTAGYHPSAQRHTSCVYISGVTPEEDFVLDAGTGFFRLIGRPLPRRLHIFLSHAHLDHVVGLTFLYNVLLGQKTELCVYGTAKTLGTIQHHLFNSPLFPLTWRYPVCAIEAGESFEVGGAQVETFMLTHPGDSLAYRFNWPQKSLAYVTDTAGDARYAEFIQDVDLLLHERNFSDDLNEVADLSGHCTSEAIVRVARASHAKQIVLTHFNPLTQTDPLEEDALREQLPGVICAYDGLELKF